MFRPFPLLTAIVNFFVPPKCMRPRYICKRLNEDKDNPQKVLLSLSKESGFTYQSTLTHGLAFNNAQQYLLLCSENVTIEFLKFKKWQVLNRA
jgi:hypothetical protein